MIIKFIDLVEFRKSFPPPHATVGQQVSDPLGRVVFLRHTEDFLHASEVHLHGGGGQVSSSKPTHTAAHAADKHAADNGEDHLGYSRMLGKSR